MRSVVRRLEDLGFEGRILIMVLAREIFITERRPLEGRRQHRIASCQARSSLCQYDRFGIDDATNVEQTISRGAASTASGCFDLRRTLVTSFETDEHVMQALERVTTYTGPCLERRTLLANLLHSPTWHFSAGLAVVAKWDAVSNILQ